MAAYIDADSRVFIRSGISYGYSFGAAGRIGVAADVEFFAASSTVYFNDDGYQANYILDYFSLGLNYTIPFAEKWSFTTALFFRFEAPGSNTYGGYLGDMYTAIRTWEDNFASTLVIRWQNQVSVTVADLGLWARLRLNVRNLAVNDLVIYGTDGLVTLSLDTRYDLILQAGVSYTFDMSNL